MRHSDSGDACDVTALPQGWMANVEHAVSQCALFFDIV